MGQATLLVSTPNSSVEAQIVTAAVAPAIINLPDSFDVAPAVVRSSGAALVTAASPAGGGEDVTVYLVGLGPVDGDIAAGDPAPGQPPLNTLYPVEVRIGSDPVSLFVGPAGVSGK